MRASKEAISRARPGATVKTVSDQPSLFRVRSDRPRVNFGCQGSGLQPGLTLRGPGEIDELRADCVGVQVMQVADQAPAQSGVDPAPIRSLSIQRLCAECEDEGKLYRRHHGTPAESVAPSVDSVESTLRQPGRPLDPGTRAFFEPRFGVDFGHVRIHTDTEASRSAAAINALAYTAGHNIVFRQGNYDPNADSGRRLLAHELTHVLQQQAASKTSDGSQALSRQTAAGPAAATAATAPTSDSLLNEWLAEHSADHLSSDLTWILSQWPSGGNINDLNADFRDDVQGLLDFVAATPAASFSIISYARAPDQQHIMHVAQYIRKSWVGYNNYKFSLWPGVVAAGGRAGLQALQPTARQSALQALASPEALAVVWDTGTQTSSRTDGTAVASAYHIGINNPVANGGATYSWPTGNLSSSMHGSGNAVDAEPVALPNTVTIRRDQARAWPLSGTAQTAFGAANVLQVPATGTEQEGFTISGLTNIARRDAFLDLFFEVRSAARAGFTDPQHFQAP